MSKCSELILIPTAAERELCADLIESLNATAGVRVQLCGWGLIQSAVLTTKLIYDHRPQRVWLVGIAGALVPPAAEDAAEKIPRSSSRSELQIGNAYEFGNVEIDGIGIGQGTAHVSFEQLGWGHLFGGPVCPGSRIDLSLDNGTCPWLLSVCSASANFPEALTRMHRFPNALAEDMESYSVASACQHLQVPLRIFRGISNRAGDRRHANWRTAEAMRSALQIATRAMHG